jgi:Protein of unknown function (DUF2917)
MDLAMHRGGMLKIQDGRGVVIEVKRGMLWLTQEGDSRDRYISAGDWLRLDSDGLAIANALKRSFVTVHHVREPLTARLRRLFSLFHAEAA